MLSELNSDARLLAVQSELEMLSFDKFIADHKVVVDATGLTKIVEHTDQLRPQRSPNFDQKTTR